MGYRGVSRTLSKIYGGVFLKIVNWCVALLKLLSIALFSLGFWKQNKSCFPKDSYFPERLVQNYLSLHIKFSLFHSTVQITVVLLIWKWVDQSFISVWPKFRLLSLKLLLITVQKKKKKKKKKCFKDSYLFSRITFGCLFRIFTHVVVNWGSLSSLFRANFYF